MIASLVLLAIEPTGKLACQTVRRCCFFQGFEDNGKNRKWRSVEPILKTPGSIHK